MYICVVYREVLVIFSTGKSTTPIVYTWAVYREILVIFSTGKSTTPIVYTWAVYREILVIFSTGKTYCTLKERENEGGGLSSRVE